MMTEIGVTDSGGYLTVNSSEGNPGAAIGSAENGSGFLSILNAEGNETAAVSSLEHGGNLTIWNKTGERVCTMEVDEYGNGVVGAYNRKGKGKVLKPGP